jgi:glucuronokinase
VTNVQCAEGAALARAALAGNPSDGYGGAVLAVTLPAWCARAEVVPAPEPEITPANPLVEATVRRFARELEPAGLETAVRWSTSIPQRVGLGSSSALVIAVVRAQCGLHGVALEPDQLAAFALAVETEDLGIVAGLQDRVAQAYEGLTFMDFGTRSNGSGLHGTYEQLDPALLPPLLIAWRSEAAGHSGEIHSSLKARHQIGEPLVAETMASLAASAREARAALLEGDLKRFGECVDRTFDLRRRLVPLDPLCTEMIEVARGCGASANYTGSGGAIVAVCPGERGLDAVADALDAIGCGVLRASATQ